MVILPQGVKGLTICTFHSNHGPISYRFRDRRWFQSKIAKFSHTPCILPPADAVPLGIGYRRRVGQNGMMRLPDCPKFFMKFSRLDSIPACDRQTSRHVATAIAALCYASREEKGGVSDFLKHAPLPHGLARQTVYYEHMLTCGNTPEVPGSPRPAFQVHSKVSRSWKVIRIDRQTCNGSVSHRFQNKREFQPKC